jgi:hypothetical protein
MRTAVGLISFVLGAYALVPASAAPVAAKAAVAKCSFKMKELSGDLLLLQEDGRYCEATGVDRAAKEQSLATYYKAVFPEEPDFAAFAAQAGASKKGVTSKTRRPSFPAGNSDAVLLKATYDYCVRQGKDARYCSEAAPGVTEYAKGQIYATCASEGIDRETCDAAILMGAQHLYDR